jgi:hypothetical protein
VWVLFLVRTIYLYECGQQPKANTLKMAFKFNLWDTHHSLNELWPPLEDAHKLQIWEFRFSHVRYPILYMCVYFNWVSTYILVSSKFRKNLDFTICPNLITTTLRPLDLVKFDWNDDIFVLKASLWSWLLHASGQSNQISIIMSPKALHIKGGMKIPNSFKCTLGQ